MQIEIDVIKLRIREFKDERKLIMGDLKGPDDMKAMTYSDMPKGNKVCISADRLLPRLNKIDIQIEREELILKSKSKKLAEMKEKLKGLTARENKIYKLIYVDRCTYSQVAQRLDISLRTVKRIVAKIKEEHN